MGASIVGFGDYRYKYASGREGDWFVMGFAPRKGALTLYLLGGLDRLAKDLAKLGKHRRGGGCLYVKNLDAVDPACSEDLKTAAAGSGEVTMGRIDERLRELSIELRSRASRGRTTCRGSGRERSST